MKKVLISILLVFVLSIIGISAGGCHCHGLGETAAERDDAHKRQTTLQDQMLIDDIDAIFHSDRPSRLTEDTVR